ncbi:hypothetical protein GCM10007112_13400 [Vulcanisaeta souniana JCM 11219]|nr:hypothetical protein GCM10007112_13400 [Vulcanisaeta souniana JCM 11219]
MQMFLPIGVTDLISVIIGIATALLLGYLKSYKSKQRYAALGLLVFYSFLLTIIYNSNFTLINCKLLYLINKNSYELSNYIIGLIYRNGTNISFMKTVTN